MKVFYSGLAVVLMALLLVSCSDDDSAPTGNNNDNNDPSGEIVSITGTLQYSAGPLASSAHLAPAGPIADYKIIAQALETQRIYLIDTESGGDFEFTVPGDDSYSFHILDDSFHYVAPLVMGVYDSTATEVPSGLEIDTADIELGNILLSESEYVAVLAAGALIQIDSTMIATAINGIPIGANNQGLETSGNNGTTLDLDGDGIINIMDSDDDGDGILDEFDADWTIEARCTVVDGINLFSNFHNHLDPSGNIPATPHDNDYIITIDAGVITGYTGTITQIAVTGPSYLNQFEIEPQGGTATNWNSYNGKKLLKDYCDCATDKRWGAFIRGVTAAHIWQVVKPGDVWVFTITYDFGGLSYTELMARKINFIFEDTPENITFDGNVWADTALGGLPDTCVIKWSTISSLPGMHYTVTGWPIVADSQHGEMFVLPAGAGIDGDSLLFVFEDTVTTGDSIEAYNIDVVASNYNGDNAKTTGGNVSK